MAERLSRILVQQPASARLRNASNTETLADTAAQLELFSGDVGSISAEEWLERLEISKEIGQWSEPKLRSVLLAKLTGAAREWHMATGIRIREFSGWKDKLMDEFSASRRLYKLENDLNERIQKGGDPLELYVWRSAVLATQLGMSAEDAKGQILTGLHHEQKFLDRELRHRTHKDIPDLLLDIQKSISFHKSLNSVWRGTEYRARLRWIHASKGNKPANALRGGTDSDNEPLYVARAMQEPDLTPGKLKQSHQKCYIPFRERELGHDYYEVLVADCPVEWVKCDARSDSARLPPGAIEGGRAGNGVPYYIGRAHHRDSVTCGKIWWPLKTCYVSWDAREWAYREFEVLTYSTIDLD